MAIVYVNGFDCEANITEEGRMWSATSTHGTYPWSVDTTGGRRGGGCIKCANGGDATNNFRQAVTASATMTAGVALYSTAWYAGGAYPLKLFGFSGPSADHIGVYVTQAGNIQVYRESGAGFSYIPSGSSLGTSSTALSLNTWNYVEAKVYVHASSGTVEVRVNGVAVVTFSGNTYNSSAGSVNVQSIYLGTVENDAVHGSGQFSKYDDFYIADGTGSSNNGFLGDVAVVGRLAAASVSLPDMWDGTTGGTRPGVVNDSSDATYIYDSSGANADLYTFGASVPAGATPKCVAVHAHAVATGAGPVLKLVSRPGGTSHLGPANALTTSLGAYQAVFETNGDTASAWRESEVNAAAFGVHNA